MLAEGVMSTNCCEGSEGLMERPNRYWVLVVVLILATMWLAACGTPVPDEQPIERAATQPTAAPTETMPAPTLSPTRMPAPIGSPTPLPESTAGSSSASLEGLSIEDFFGESYKQLLLRDPEYLTAIGLSQDFGLRNDRLRDLSDAYIRETQELEVAILDLLRSYDRDELTPDQQVSYDVYEWYLDNQVRGHQFMYHDYPLHHFIRGYHFELDSLFGEIHPLDNRRDVEDCVARLSQVDDQVEQLMEGLRIREELGVIPPAYIIEMARQDMVHYLDIRSPPVPYPHGLQRLCRGLGHVR